MTDYCVEIAVWRVDDGQRTLVWSADLPGRTYAQATELADVFAKFAMGKREGSEQCQAEMNVVPG